LLLDAVGGFLNCPLSFGVWNFQSQVIASREPMKARFYAGELWRRELENILLPMLDRMRWLW
jgi:hypothetical protein